MSQFSVFYILKLWWYTARCANQKELFVKSNSLKTLCRFDLEDFKYNQVNMTAFRIVDSDNDEVMRILQEMESISAIGKSILNQSQVKANFYYKFIKK